MTVLISVEPECEMFVTLKKPSPKHDVVNRLLQGKEEDFYGAGPSPGCGMIRLIIRRIFRGVKTDKRAPANGEVSQVGITDKRRTPKIQGDTIPLDENLVSQKSHHT